MEKNMIIPENGLITLTIQRELLMDNDNPPETFNMRLTRLKMRLKEIDENHAKQKT